MASKMYGKINGEWVPVYPEPSRGTAPVLSAAPDATQIVYTWTAASGLTVASYELEFDGAVQNVGNVLTFTKTGLTTGQSYAARVRAKSSENVRGPWSNLLNTVAAVPFNDATGGTITTSTTYKAGETWRIHAFTGAGTFTVTKAPQTFDLWIVGGGSGGNEGYQGTSGGGNGGQVIERLAQTLAVQAYTMSPGGGGYSGGQSGTKGGPGGSSTGFGSTASGGPQNLGIGAGSNGSGAKVAPWDSSQRLGFAGNTRGGGGIPGYGNGGQGGATDGMWGDGGNPGAVVIAYRIG